MQQPGAYTDADAGSAPEHSALQDYLALGSDGGPRLGMVHFLNWTSSNDHCVS